MLLMATSIGSNESRYNIYNRGMYLTARTELNHPCLVGRKQARVAELLLATVVCEAYMRIENDSQLTVLRLT